MYDNQWRCQKFGWGSEGTVSDGAQILGPGKADPRMPKKAYKKFENFAIEK